MDKKSIFYQKSMELANEVYGKKTSAYRSAYIVKMYKELGGKMSKSPIRSKSPVRSKSPIRSKSKRSKLNRWFDEKWIQVIPYLKHKKIIECGGKTKSIGKACRPLIRITKDTPITIKELEKIHSKEDLIRTAKIKNKSPNKRISWKKLLVK